MLEQSFQDQMNSIDQWLSELQLLGVSPKRRNDKKELQDFDGKHQAVIVPRK